MANAVGVWWLGVKQRSAIGGGVALSIGVEYLEPPVRKRMVVTMCRRARWLPWCRGMDAAAYQR